MNNKHDGAKDNSRGAEPGGSRGTRVYPLHPFLLAAASVLALYASNVKEASFHDILPALLSVLGFTALVFLVLAMIFRHAGARTALLASIVVIGSLFYDRLFFWVDRTVGGGVAYGGFLALFLAVLALLFVLVARTRSRNLILPHSMLNGIALVLVATPVFQAVQYEWQHARPGLIAPVEAPNGPFSTAVAAAAAPQVVAADRPDIYYLIFDRYASAATLSRYFDFDNQPLLGFLKKKGFYVAPESHANYLKTGHSVASTFHMDYLDFLAENEEGGSRSSDWDPIYRLLGKHRVAQFLKSAGYRYTQIGSWWSATQANPYADANPQFGFREFTGTYARDRLIHPLLRLVAPDSSYTHGLQWDSGQCQRIPWQIEQIKKAGGGPEPAFVFAHLLLPHEPYMFDPQGRCLSREQSQARGNRQGYVEQVRYANKVIEDLVNSLQSREGRPPVIIIQADEGPFPETDIGHTRSWREATHDELQIKMGILNAYYFPDADYKDLYPSITPVNSFRMLFNKYFDAGLERLPDRLQGFPNIFRLYEFFDMTEAVRGHED